MDLDLNMVARMLTGEQDPGYLVQTSDTGNVQAFTFVPNQDTQYYAANKSGLEVLEELVSLLPSIDHDFGKDYSDYPHVPTDLLNEVGVCFHMRRPVFVLGGVAFFRRYNDDWNGCVMSARNGGRDTYVSWDSGDIGSKALAQLRDLVKAEGVHVTRDQVLAALR